VSTIVSSPSGDGEPRPIVLRPKDHLDAASADAVVRSLDDIEPGTDTHNEALAVLREPDS